VYVSFVVNVTGAIDQIEILRSPSEGFNDEVVRVVKKMPMWKPGIQGGQKVAVRYKLPVKFSLKS
jgi:protein TonB